MSEAGRAPIKEAAGRAPNIGEARYLSPSKDPSLRVVFTGSLTRLGPEALRELLSNVMEELPRDKLLEEVLGKGELVDEVRTDRYIILVSERTYADWSRGDKLPRQEHGMAVADVPRRP